MTSEKDDCIKQSLSNEPLVGVGNKTYINEEESVTNSTQTNNESVIQSLSVKETVTDNLMTRCGWFGTRPQFLQRFNTPKWVLFWLCWAGALQGFIVNGGVNLVITTIEKRYQMRSTESGLIAGGYDVASFLFLIPISYFGGTRSKPLFIGIGVIIMGCGALVFSSPYFTAGRYEFSHEVEHVCNGNLDNPYSCSNNTSNEKLSNYKYIFFLGQFLHGVGATPLYTLGVAYIDESVSTQQSSVYLGIYYAMALVGPGIGYMLGGQFLNWFYVDWFYVNPDDLGLTPTSIVWVGAWYFIFFIGFIIAIIITFPIISFPKELPETKQIREKKISEIHSNLQNSKAEKDKQFGHKAKDLPESFKILMLNPTFIFLNLAGATEGMLISAMATFLPKVIEQQFSMSASASAVIVGIVTLPGAAGGTFLGGYFVKRYKLKCASIIKFCLICTLVAIFFGFAFFISCPNVKYAGINEPYPDQQAERALSIESHCNANCSCSEYRYDPVCGLNNQLFYSPCHAGCKHVYHHQNSKVYWDCSCLQGVSKSEYFQWDSIVLENGTIIHVEAIREKCKTECNLMPPFTILLFFTMVFTFLVSMPSLTATLRCVPDSQKSFALGIQWMAIRLLGTIPAPLIFGSLIDLSCILWQRLCDQNSSGSCLFYDNQRMSLNLVLITLSIKFLSFIFFFLAWFLYKPPIAVNNVQREVPNNIKIETHDDTSVSQSECCPKLKHKQKVTKL